MQGRIIIVPCPARRYYTIIFSPILPSSRLQVRQVLIRRELDELAKVLGEKARTGDATCEDYFELGAVLMRKRLFTQVTGKWSRISLESAFPFPTLSH